MRAASATLVTFSAICDEPYAASLMLRAISSVVERCSSAVAVIWVDTAAAVGVHTEPDAGRTRPIGR